MACELTLNQVLEATGGEIVSQVVKSFHGVGTDTRENLSQKIFIALKGENYDAHDFLPQAVQNGAKALIVDRLPDSISELKDKVTIVKVGDTLKGLQDLAKFWRKQIKAVVFGITGSNGKTTTKEFLATILSEQFKVHFSRGSFNNHWGVPITLLGISKFHDVAIVEMGMNHAGELAQLSKFALPDVVVCTMVGRAHVGQFENGIQGIADAKEEIYLSNPKAKKIFNYDNEYTLKMYERVSKLQGVDETIVYSSFSGGAEVSLRANSMTLDGLKVIGHIAGIKGEALVPVFGRHNITNLMAAAAMALTMKMEPELIWSAMAKCHGQWGRGQLYKLPNGTRVLFDAYNANPDSMSALIKNIFEIPNMAGKKIAVLGEMLELGDQASQLHAELGEMVGNTDIDTVWFYGEHQKDFQSGFKHASPGKNLIISNTYEEELAKKLQSMLNPQDIVIIKGSRGMKMERVLKLWDPQFSTDK